MSFRVTSLPYSLAYSRSSQQLNGAPGIAEGQLLLASSLPVTREVLQGGYPNASSVYMEIKWVSGSACKVLQQFLEVITQKCASTKQLTAVREASSSWLQKFVSLSTSLSAKYSN